MVEIQYSIWLPVRININVEVILAPVFSAAHVQFLGEFSPKHTCSWSGFLQCLAQDFRFLSLREPLEPASFQLMTLLFVPQKRQATLDQRVIRETQNSISQTWFNLGLGRTFAYHSLRVS